MILPPQRPPVDRPSPAWVGPPRQTQYRDRDGQLVGLLQAVYRPADKPPAFCCTCHVWNPVR